ncbi:hypothetical protein GGR58DRAFT_505461 [Xylaria digitata]|nr:hypothetical protein GGR58DRAFT_505461 [Xylaria digitata]
MKKLDITSKRQTLSQNVVAAFAIEATRHLLGLLNSGLWQEGGDDQFVAALAGTILAINEDLGTRSPTAKTREDIIILLSNLERLCWWPTKPVPSNSKREDWPGLKHRFRRLASLSEKSPSSPALKSILLLSSASNRVAGSARIGLLENLKQFPRQRRSEKEAHLTLRSRTVYEIVLHDHHDIASLLHTTLQAYCICGSQTISTLLRLKVDKLPDQDSVTFNTFFAIHPHKIPAEIDSNWQVAKISAVGGHESSGRKPIAIDAQSFCEMICRTRQEPLSITVSESFLSLGGDMFEPSRSWIPTGPVVTLYDLLKQGGLGRKARYVLMFMITKAIWQFFNTGWLLVPWTAKTVQFMVERRKGQEGIYPDEPFILAHFEEQKDKQMDNRFHVIKNLGVLLLELEKNKVMEDEMDLIPNRRELEGLDELGKARYIAWTVYDNPEKTENIPDGLLGAIVLQAVEAIFQVSDDISWSKPAAQPHHARRMYPATSLRFPYAEALETAPSATGRILSLPENDRPSSEQWFNQLDELDQVLQAREDEQGGSYQRVRIAILDTGIREDSQ